MEESHGSRDSLQRELTRERLKNARRSNAVRFWGVSAFFLLFLVLGGLPFSFRTVNLKNGVQKQPEHLAINRYGQVPVLLSSFACWLRSG